MGIDVDRVYDFQNIDRDSFEVVRGAWHALAQRQLCQRPAVQAQLNMETSGYAQDRWTPKSRILIEPGIRFDTDEIVHGVAPSPRIAATLMLNKAATSKLSAGIGTYRDASNLSILTTSAGRNADGFVSTTRHRNHSLAATGRHGPFRLAHNRCCFRTPPMPASRLNRRFPKPPICASNCSTAAHLISGRSSILAPPRCPMGRSPAVSS